MRSSGSDPTSKDSLHNQVSQREERSLLIEETTPTSGRKRGRPPKVLSEQNTKSLKKAAFSPAGEKTNQEAKEMNPEATLKHCTATGEENQSLPFSKHNQVSQREERSLLIEETTPTSGRKRGRPPKVLSEQNTKSLKKAAFSPAGEKTNQEAKEMNPEATLKHCTATGEENQSLPFSKASPVWLAFDSMEAFKKFPQKPHFAPLHELKEVHREGLAIGNMVTFSTLVGKALVLHCSNPKSSFHECLETLNDLECHGFDIKPVELHIKKMLSMKEKQERFTEKVRVLEELIKELNQANERIDEETGELTQKVKGLESERGKNELKVETLRKSLEGMRKEMELGLVN